jgi:hypothetical protein
MIAADQDQGRHATTMNEDKATGKATRPMRNEQSRGGKRAKPEWANGLRQLYDNVVNEPLPDSFADLISKLDESGK